jgi:hypothetical protein
MTWRAVGGVGWVSDPTVGWSEDRVPRVWVESGRSPNLQLTPSGLGFFEAIALLTCAAGRAVDLLSVKDHGFTTTVADRLTPKENTQNHAPNQDRGDHNGGKYCEEKYAHVFIVPAIKDASTDFIGNPAKRAVACAFGCSLSDLC